MDTTGTLRETFVSHGNKSEAICNSTTPSGDDNSIDQLTTGLSSKLKINDENQTNNIMVDEYYIEDEEEEEYSDAEEEEEEEGGNYFSEEELLALMGYTKSTPKRDDPEKFETHRLLEESILAQLINIKEEPPKHEPIATPTSELNLVSALKGSRGQEGLPAKERRVSWDPDVYDPPPNLYNPLPASESVAGKHRQKGGGKKAGATEDEGGGGKRKKRGGSKGGVGKGKTAGKAKDKKYGDRKQAKKRGGDGASNSKYSDFGEF
ncbi:hypothetical protein OROHE_001637 [Orobanche hederae]